MGLFMDINQSILGENTWPPPALSERWAEIELFAALRASDETRLRQQAWVQWRQPYMISPVPRMISRASANLLFAIPPDITDESETDQDNLDFIVDENDLPAEAHRAALMSSSEGEVWGRIIVDPALLDVPIIEFVSGSRVIPEFSGRFVMAATFVTEWATGSVERIRLLERYEPGAVVCTLYRGTTTNLGSEIPLDSFEETKGRAQVVPTGIEWPLVAFIPNTIDTNPCWGYSDYQGLIDRFFALNEASTIGQHNMRLAGAKRGFIDEKYVSMRGAGSSGGGGVPQWDDIFIRQGREKGDLQDKPTGLQVLDYQFQAQETVHWLDHMIDTTLTYAGVAPQLVGRGDLGRTPSGTALKLRAAFSLLEASGKGRYFDRGLKRLLRAAKIIDSRRTTEGGFGRNYATPDTDPAIERDTGLPRDDVEAAQEVAQLVGAEAISLEERVAFLHPDWSDEQLAEEVQRIKDEQPTAAPAGGIETPAPQLQLNLTDAGGTTGGSPPRGGASVTA